LTVERLSLNHKTDNERQERKFQQRIDLRMRNEGKKEYKNGIDRQKWEEKLHELGVRTSELGRRVKRGEKKNCFSIARVNKKAVNKTVRAQAC